MKSNKAAVKLPVKAGCDYIRNGNLEPKLMTRAQAERYASQAMPNDLKRAGFQAFISETSLDLNGWNGYRINYGK